MKRILFAILVSVLFTGCGQSDEEKEKEVSERIKGKFAFKLWGKTLYVDDKLYELSCNQFMMPFFATKAAPTCVGVTVKTDYVSGEGSADGYHKWTIKSNNGSVNVDGREANDKLTINGVTYSCLMYSGEAYSTNPDDSYVSGTHTVIAKTTATKPSEVKEEEVYALAPNYQDVCDAWQ